MSEPIEYSIHRALSENNTLEKKINKVVKNTNYIAARKRGSKIYDQHTDEEFSKMVKANSDALNALIENKNKIKARLDESNAKTVIKINGTEMTVAEALVRKNNIKYDEMVLEQMKRRLAIAEDKLEEENYEAKNKLDRHIETTLGKKENQKATDIDTLTKIYNQHHEWVMIDPIKLRETIAELEEKIFNFTNELNFVLAESNTITKIYI